MNGVEVKKPYLPAKGVKAESTISGAGSSSSTGADCFVGGSYPIGVAKSTFRSHSIIDIACSET